MEHTAEQRQLIGTKKIKLCSRLIGQPVLCGFVVNGSGGLPHHVAEIWTDRNNMFLVHLKAKWFFKVVDNNKVKARHARVFVKRNLTQPEEQQQETWIQKAISLIASTQSNDNLDGITSQEEFKANRYRELSIRCQHGQLKTSFCQDCNEEIKAFRGEL